MSMTREAMDRVLNDHFRLAAEDDFEGLLNTFTADAELETITSPMGPVNTPKGRREWYKVIFRCLAKSRKSSNSRELRRSYGEDFIIYETAWTGHVSDGLPFLCEGASGEVSTRFMHIFDFRDGKISREQVWIDLAPIQKALSSSRAE
jgi:ketosteroid isomerase-like protein